MISKRPSDSKVESRYLVLPEHANQFGTAFGGVIMSWIDQVAAMAAIRHCGHEAVTANIDQLSFYAPIQIGDHVVMQASVNYVHKTSMEIGVKVTKENPYTNESVTATIAYLTFVGLDAQKKPVIIPQIEPETEDEKRRFKNAELRVKSRLELRKKLI